MTEPSTPHHLAFAPRSSPFPCQDQLPTQSCKYSTDLSPPFTPPGLCTCCLLPETTFPLLYNSGYLSCLLGSTPQLQVEPVTPPSQHPKPSMHHLLLHPVTVIIDICARGNSPSLGGGVSNVPLCPRPSSVQGTRWATAHVC